MARYEAVFAFAHGPLAPTRVVLDHDTLDDLSTSVQLARFCERAFPLSTVLLSRILTQ